MSQEICEFSKSHATEQAQPQEATLLEEDEYDDCIYEEIGEWAQRGSEQAFYNEPALKLNEKYGIWSRVIVTAYLKKLRFNIGAEKSPTTLQNADHNILALLQSMPTIQQSKTQRATNHWR